MPEYNASLAGIQMPARIARLAVSPQGFPIPYFVHKDPLDFRVIAPKAFGGATGGGRCWICGEPRGRMHAFVAGPMCGVTRTVSEPPSHRECAEFAVRACPFLANPRMRRNTKDMPDHVPPPGVPIYRNPGVSLVWMTRTYKLFRAGGGGVLIEMGEPLEINWYCQGRAATRAEVEESIQSGMPALIEQVGMEPTERQRLAAKKALAYDLTNFMRWLPKTGAPPSNDGSITSHV